MSADAIPRLNAALEGHYRIERQLGEGGMATVYLADDLRHERKVAVKVLKPELAAVVGAERFLAEIKTTANLQHPHILPLHDSGEADGFLFYVMPYVEGESLRERLDREHQLPVDEAVRIATNVAEALGYAHTRGVIHRDIKPANVLLQSGKPVMSDFGIALAVGAAGGGRLTETGLSVGTPHYMSPEQATGDVGVGFATDIYALGCVLYEMLVGEPPYTGSTAQAVLGKIVTADLDPVTKHRRSVPENVDAAIRRALEKIPADRFAKAADFARALTEPGFRHGGKLAAGLATPAGPWRSVALAMAALAAVSTSVAVRSQLRPEPAAPIARLEVPLDARRSLVSVANRGEFTLSPDGSRIVYVGEAIGGLSQLWIRPLAEDESVPIPGTDDAHGPEMSPDGQSVAFERGPGINTVSLRGALPLSLVEEGSWPSWGSDRYIYYGVGRVIYRIPEEGGEAEAFTQPSAGEHRYPHALPGGRGVLLTVFENESREESRVAVVGPDGGEVREILAGTTARYAASGHIVFTAADGRLMAAPFDLDLLDATGPAVALPEAVYVEPNAFSQFALSNTGILLYKARNQNPWELVWVTREGFASPVDPDWSGDFLYPALSRDGGRVALSVQGTASRDIWIKQLDTGPRTLLTREGSRNDYPTWTPDGTSVTFFSSRAGGTDLWTRRADGVGEATLLLDLTRDVPEAQWVPPDGEWLVFRTNFAQRGSGDILAIRVAQDTVPVEIVATDAGERQPTFSPDGRWMAYVSDSSERDEIYVVPFPEADQIHSVSASGGTEPVWSPSGTEIFYRNLNGDLVSVETATEPTFSAGEPQVLFAATPYRADALHPNYDVDADNDRFLMIRPVGGQPGDNLNLVLNYYAELERLAPH